MIPDRYTTEKMAYEHRQTLLREAEQERMLALVDSPKHVLQNFAGKLGRSLLVLGTKLQQCERRSEADTVVSIRYSSLRIPWDDP